MRLPHINGFIAAAVFAATLTGIALARPYETSVIDEDHLMSAAQVESFDNLSEELLRKTGISMAATLLDGLRSRDARTYASEAAAEWKATSQANGAVMILLSLKERRSIVETAGTANQVLTGKDIERLKQQKLFPAFRQTKYGEGVLAFAYAVATEIAREKGVTLDVEAPSVSEEAPMTVRGWIFIFAVFAILLLLRYLHPKKERHLSRGDFGGGGRW